MKAIELEKAYNPKDFEDRIYSQWEQNKSFKPDSDKNPEKSGAKKAYTVVIPPPNVTGVLHMGHGLNNTLQDIVVRYHRMKGEDTLWVPGTDHAGIATQAKVMERLRKEGVDVTKITREEFLKEAWGWKDEYASSIHDQWAKMGLALDYTRERFTLDEGLNYAVRTVFTSLYNM